MNWDWDLITAVQMLSWHLVNYASFMTRSQEFSD